MASVRDPCPLLPLQHPHNQSLQFICEASELGDSDTVHLSQQLYLKLSEDKSKKTIIQIAETRERAGEREAGETTTVESAQLSKSQGSVPADRTTAQPLSTRTRLTKHRNTHPGRRLQAGIRLCKKQHINRCLRTSPTTVL